MRCKFWLEQFHREGLCSKKSRKPTGRNIRSLTVDAFTYIADREKIQAKLREHYRKIISVALIGWLYFFVRHICSNVHDLITNNEATMKIKDYPKQIAAKEQYTSGDVAIVLGVSLRTASIMLKNNVIKSFTLPGLTGRRVLHTELVTFLNSSPDYAYALAKIVDEVEEPKS